MNNLNINGILNRDEIIVTIKEILHYFELNKQNMLIKKGIKFLDCTNTLRGQEGVTFL